MPTGAQHDRITRGFLGWNLPGVHRAMDSAVKVVGPRHRFLMHGAAAVRAMQLLYGRAGRVVAGLHLLQDLGILRGDTPMPRDTRGTRPGRAGGPVRVIEGSARTRSRARERVAGARRQAWDPTRLNRELAAIEGRMRTAWSAAERGQISGGRRSRTTGQRSDEGGLDEQLRLLLE